MELIEKLKYAKANKLVKFVDLEKKLNIPSNTLTMVCKGTRGLASKYVDDLEEYLDMIYIDNELKFARKEYDGADSDSTYESIAESITKEAYTELTDAILEERSNDEISIKEKLLDDLEASNDFHRDYLNSIQLSPTTKKQITITLDTESGRLEISDAIGGLSSVEIVGILRLACLKFEKEIIK